MRKLLSKPIVRAIVVLCLLTFVAVNLLFLWIATGPRLLNGLTPYVEKALASADGTYSVSIGQTWLMWGDWRHPIDIKLREITIVTHEGKKFVSFPEISVGISLWSLPLGQILPTSITLNQPTVSLFQNEDRSITFGFGEFTPPEPAPDAEAETVETEALPTAPVQAFLALFASGSDSGLRALRRFDIHNAKVTLGNIRRSIFLKVTGVEFSAKRSRSGNIRIVAGGNLNYKSEQSAVGIEVLLGDDQPFIQTNLVFDRLVPGTLASLFADIPVLKMYNAPLSGKLSANIDKDGAVDSLAFDIKGDGGHISSDLLAKPIPINTVHAEGQLSNGGKDIQINSLAIGMDKINLHANGAVAFDKDDLAINGQVTAQNVEAGEVGMFWPPGLAPLSREWVTTNITEGAVPEARVKVNIRFGDLARPVLPKEAVDASIAIENTTIRYLPNHPPVTKARGIIRIDGVGLNADIASAQYLQGSALSGGKVLIDDLNADNPYIKVSLDATAPAKEAVQFLALPRLQHAKTLGLETDTSGGTASVHADVGFYFFAPKDENGNTGEPDIDYDITGSIKEFSAPQFLHKFDIKDGAGVFTINKHQLTFKGTGNVNGAIVSQADVTYKFTPENGYDTLIDVSAIAPVESLKRFGYPEMTFAKGTFGVKANVKQGPEVESSTASIDLTQTSIDMDMIGWVKPAAEPATFDIAAEKQNGALTVTSLRLAGKNAETSGSAALNKDFSAVSRLSLQKTVLGNINLDRLEYEKSAGHMRVEMVGRSLDLSGWLDGDKEKKDNEFSFEQFPAMQFKSDVARLTLSKQGSISNFKGELYCSELRCESANITGVVGDNKEFNFRILRNPKGKRQVSLRAYDFGTFLKAFGLYPNIDGGDLSLTGNYTDSKADSVLSGRFVIDNYTVKKAPILAKILSLTSITGVVDTLQGNGITFTKLVAPFTLQNDIVTFTKAKAYGSSIGITANGTIQFPKRYIDISGTVVPAYVVNKILDKVPLVGALLTGGGEGIFAFDYRVRGPEEEAEVSVNPLSILKPGFLRGMFDGMEGSEQPAQ